MKILFSTLIVFNFLAISFVINSSIDSREQRIIVSNLAKTLVVKRESVQSGLLDNDRKSYYCEVGEAYWVEESEDLVGDVRQENISLCDVVYDKTDSVLDKFGLVIIARRCVSEIEKDNEKYLSFLKANKLESFYDPSCHQFSVIASFPEIKNLLTRDLKVAYVLDWLKNIMLKNHEGVFDDLCTRKTPRKIYRYAKTAIPELFQEIDRIANDESRGIKRSRE